MGEAQQAEAADRAGSYRWLSRWFLSPPDEAMVAGLMTTAARAFLGESQAAGTGDLTAQVEALAVLWTRLFSAPGPDQVPPYESVHRDRPAWGRPELFGTPTIDAQLCYAEAGYALDPAFGTLGDHLGVELAFMALLCAREAEAAAAGEMVRALEWAARQRQFIGAHLSRWLPAFARQVEASAPGSLYARLARRTEEMVASETAPNPQPI